MSAILRNKGSENQLVGFRLGTEEYGVDIIRVQEIIKVPEITRVPWAPDFVEGVINLRGTILPIVSARKRFGLAETENKKTARIIVTDISGKKIGLIVDSVSEVLRISGENVESPPDIIASTGLGCLSGIGKINGGKRLISLLELERFLDMVSHSGETTRMGRRGGDEESFNDTQKKAEDESLLVSFRLGSEEYAFEVDYVEEIVRIPEITEIPEVPYYVRGVLSLRGRVLPVISLHRKFGIPEEEFDDRARILIINTFPNSDNKLTFGAMVSGVNEVLTVPKNYIEQPSAVIKTSGNAHLKGIGKLNNGKRLIQLLDTSKLLGIEMMDNLVNSLKEKDDLDNGRTGEKNMNEQQLVIFRLGKEEFGLNIMNVQEIVRMTEITEIPGSPEHVRGVVNLRGGVLPVIDLRKRFMMESKQHTDSQRIVVVNYNSATTGIIVDSVSEVLRLPDSCIEPPPTVAQGINAGFIESIGKIEKGKRFIIILSLANILQTESPPESEFVEESFPVENTGEPEALDKTETPEAAIATPVITPEMEELLAMVDALPDEAPMPEEMPESKSERENNQNYQGKKIRKNQR